MREFKLESYEHFKKCWERIKSGLFDGFAGEKPVLLTLQRPSKTRAQEKLAHALISDIVATARISINGLIIDFKAYEKDANIVGKALFVRWFEIEMSEAGTPLQSPGRTIINPVNGEQLQIRPSTAQFRVAEYSLFIEYLYSLGAEHGAVFQDKTAAEYEQWLEQYGKQ